MSYYIDRFVSDVTELCRSVKWARLGELVPKMGYPKPYLVIGFFDPKG